MTTRFRGGLVVALALLAGCESSTTNTISTTIANPFAPTPTTAATCPTGTCGTCATGTCGTPTLPGILNPQQRIPEIAIFASDSYRIGRWDGVGTFLRWDVSDNLANVRIDPYPGNVPAVGSVVVFPGVTTTYTLTARNNVGTVQRQLTILVIE